MLLKRGWMVKPYIHQIMNFQTSMQAQVFKRGWMVKPLYIHQIMTILTNTYKMARTEKRFEVTTTYTLLFIICESKSAIHRSCYNLPFGGSFVGSSKTLSVPRPFCNSLYVWTGLVSHSISNSDSIGVFPIPSSFRCQNGGWIVLVLFLFSSTVLLNVPLI